MIRCTPIGSFCYSWAFGDVPSVLLSQKILGVYRNFKEDLPEGVVDVVPAYTELAIYLDPSFDEPERVKERVNQRIQNFSFDLVKSYDDVRNHMIPVIYAGEDLEWVAQYTGLPLDEVIRLHTKPLYTVAMIGFMPHFPYCLGLPKELQVPRRPSPRPKVPAGAVAIAGCQTGVYPQISPGGWNLIGSTDPSLLHAIRPGDTLCFKQVGTLA